MLRSTSIERPSANYTPLHRYRKILRYEIQNLVREMHYFTYDLQSSRII